jgi:hypothetical protein
VNGAVESGPVTWHFGTDSALELPAVLTAKGGIVMNNHVSAVLEVVLALVSLLPWIAPARLAGNHNQTRLRG